MKKIADLNMESSINIEEMQAKYARLRPQYLRFTAKLESLLNDLLNAKSLGHHLIESRTKEINSFTEKITNSSNAYKNPLIEFTDLSGLRIITYYQDDAYAIGELVKSEFLIDTKNSVDHGSQLAEFGYRSSHYVVQLTEARTNLLEWDGLSEFKAEIQVRTVLQHAWAAISHKLQYKREEDIPSQLRRKLFRLSALFELADDEFISLRNASGTFSRAIDTRLTSGEREIEIDYVSLSQFLNKFTTINKLCAFAEKVGFSFEDLYPDDDEDDDRDSISDLIKLAFFCEISTIAEFERIINASISWAYDYLNTQFMSASNETKSSWHVSPPFICELILIHSQASKLSADYLMQIGWDPNIANRVFKIAQEFRQPSLKN